MSAAPLLLIQGVRLEPKGATALHNKSHVYTPTDSGRCNRSNIHTIWTFPFALALPRKRKTLCSCRSHQMLRLKGATPCRLPRSSYQQGSGEHRSDPPSEYEWQGS
jgi:hypothetical protein